MIKVTDLESLSDFMQQIIDAVPGIDDLLVVSNGEDGIEEIDNYFKADYEGGVTAILQIPQIDRQGDDRLGFLCSLTILKKPADQSLSEKLKARNVSFKLMMAAIGQLELAMDESIQTIETPDESWTIELNVHHNNLFSIGRIANVFAVGWYVDIDLVIPANHLLFPV